MHATIALCLMVVGGPLPPDPQVTIQPLYVDPNGPTIQEQEWQQRVKRHALPPVPSIYLLPPSTARDDRYEGRGKYGYGTSDPNQSRKVLAAPPPAPTEPGEGYGNRQVGTPAVPGGGLGAGTVSGRNDLFNTAGGMPGQRPVTAGYNSGSNYSAPGLPSTPTIATQVANSVPTNYGLTGISTNPMLNVSPGGGPKPFDDYQRPNGYSPWMGLYNTPTAGGTVSPYYASVQPAFQQQQYNAQTTAQIRGVYTNPRMYNSGTPGGDTYIQGAGQVNPNSYLNMGGSPTH